MFGCLLGFDGFGVGVFDDGRFGSFDALGLLVFVTGGFGLFVLFVEGLADVLLLGHVFLVALVHTDRFSELFLGTRFLTLTFLIFMHLYHWLNRISSLLSGRNGRLFTKRFHLRSQRIIRRYYGLQKKILSSGSSS